MYHTEDCLAGFTILRLTNRNESVISVEYDAATSSGLTSSFDDRVVEM